MFLFGLFCLTAVVEIVVYICNNLALLNAY
jgi:hypothetical protein